MFRRQQFDSTWTIIEFVEPVWPLHVVSVCFTGPAASEFYGNGTKCFSNGRSSSAFDTYVMSIQIHQAVGHLSWILSEKWPACILAAPNAQVPMTPLLHASFGRQFSL